MSSLAGVKLLHFNSRKRQEARDDAARQCKKSWGNMPLRKADIMIPYGSYTQIMVIYHRNVEEAMQRRRQERELQRQHKILQLSRRVFGRRLMDCKIRG
jgi:hypothetical protein